MKILIIKSEIAEKLRSIEFPKLNRLDPVKGVISGEEVEWLPADLKDVEVFAEVLKDFEACEVKEIKTIETKYFDPETKQEVLPTDTVIEAVGITDFDPKQPLYGEDRMIFEEMPIDIFSMECKTILS